MHTSKIKIGIVDDYEVFRDGLKVSLSADDRLEVVIEAGNGEELIKQLALSLPDVVLMDLNMPVLDGAKATQLIQRQYPSIKVLIVSMYEDDQFIQRAVENGAHGYLVKDAEPEEIRAAIHAVINNGYYFYNNIDLALLQQVIKRNRLQGIFNSDTVLTDEEQVFLSLMIEKKNAADISSNHQMIKTLLEKTGAPNIPGLLMFAMNNSMG